MLNITVTLVKGYSNGGLRSESGPLMATAGPRQHLKGVFYTQKFLSLNFALLAVPLKHLLPANYVIVDQAVAQVNCSAHLS